MITQQQFDSFIKDYNENFLLLLTRASVCHYDCLITSWVILKDLYDIIITIHDMGEVSFHQLPHPFSFRGNDILLSQLGFKAEEISNIYGFFAFVLKTQGKDFDECVKDGAKVMCAKLKPL